MKTTHSITVGIDVGTSACRVMAIDEQGSIVASDRLAMPETGTMQDPAMQWQTVKLVLGQVITQCAGLTIKAINVDATSGSVMMTNHYGRPISAMLMYHDDRAIEQSKKIVNLAPAHSGAHGPTSGLAKLCFFQQQTLPSEAQFIHQADWINFNLGAPLGITDENNALKTGYDPVKRRWPQWLDHVTNTHYLPVVVPVGKTIGRLSTALCREFKLTIPPDIIAGTTDSIAGVIATGIKQTGQAVTSLGSTLVVKLISGQAVFVPKQGIYSHRLANRWLVGGASNTGGAPLRHFFLIKPSTSSVHKSISSHLRWSIVRYCRQASASLFDDPTYAPRLTPGPASDVHFCHSLLQSIANIERLTYQCLAAAGAHPVTAVYTVGGGAKNPIWTTIRERTLAVPIVLATQTEAAYGNALIAQGHINTLCT